MRTLVIAPCSAKKRGDAPNPATAADLADPERRRQAEARLADLASPALEIYTGTHHLLVMEGVQAVWQRWGRETLDLAILSGGYGLLRADDRVIPYNVTFDQFDEQALADWAGRLRIPEQAASLAGRYDLAFYLLSGRYLAVLDLPLDVPASVQQIVLTGQDSLALVPAAPNIHPFVASGTVAARRWHVKAPHVRGFLFRRLCNQIAYHGPVVLEWLSQHPEDTELLFYKRARWRPQMPLWQDSNQGS
ncbi:MAG: hypothetical protein PVF77_10665 [Anaerolineae bacterium]|jgi:hypothetical protein